MELGLEGRSALVTGAASGIGAACALALADEGAALALVDRDEIGVARTLAEVEARGARACQATADVSDEESLAAAVAWAGERLGAIDLLVTCAGISGPFGVEVEEIALADWNAVLGVNVTGPFLAVKHALPYLERSPESTIVFLASDSGFVAAPGMVAYNASKGALVQLTRALSVDLAPRDIRVNCVCPSIVDTPMSRGDLGLEEGGFADFDYPVQTPEEVARHVLYLSSPASRPVNGTALVSDFGYLARSSFPA